MKIGLKILFIVIILINSIKANAQNSAVLEISKETYYDKTLGCIIGQIGGFLSGYEFVRVNGKPYIGMPDDWFSIGKGPYGGGEKHGSAGNNCVITNGKIRQDDDYFIDFFNQLIFNQNENLPTALDIQKMWKLHQVRDWGGGAKAMEIMNKNDFVPPFTGMLEFGNIYSWCTEPYIENETLGCIAPGLPQTACALTNKFGMATGEYESVIWAQFYGVMYSIAYFQNSSIDAMSKAADIFPKWSRAKFIYDQAISLKQKYPDDWRSAAKELELNKRSIYRSDNDLCSYDVNGGFLVLSILYGNNDYYQTLKVASLIGYDGDCTAAIAGGLMGIIKGLSGTDNTLKEIVYNNGTGELINDGVYIPYISQGYPAEQKFTDIALLYQSNTEKVLSLTGRGTVLSDKYTIQQESVKVGCNVDISNRDFEDNTLGVKAQFINGAQGGIDMIQSFAPHSGTQTARIIASQQGAGGQVYIQTNNLEIGKRYRVSGYLIAKGDNRASLFIKNGNNFLTSSTYGNDSDWYNRSIIFDAVEPSANIGLYVPPIKGGLFNAYLDDITIEECNQTLLQNYEAESLINDSQSVTININDTVNASNNQYISVVKGSKIKNINIQSQNTGEYLMRIWFSNNSNSVVTARVMNSSGAQVKFPFYVTGDKLYFEENFVDVPVNLNVGENNLSLEQFSGDISLDRLEILSDSSFYKSNDSYSSGLIPLSDHSEVKVMVSSDRQLIIQQDSNKFTDASIYSISGQNLLQLKLQPNITTFSASSLQYGIYLIYISGLSGSKVLKFMIN